jgi:hypothetical protein
MTNELSLYLGKQKIILSVISLKRYSLSVAPSSGGLRVFLYELCGFII